MRMLPYSYDLDDDTTRYVYVCEDCRINYVGKKYAIFDTENKNLKTFFCKECFDFHLNAWTKNEKYISESI